MRMMLLPGVIYRGIGARICRNGLSRARLRGFDGVSAGAGWLRPIAPSRCPCVGFALDDFAGPQMACNQMLRRHFQERRLFAPAPLLCVRAARMKAAACRRIDRARHIAAQHPPLSASGRIGNRHSFEERFRVRMLWRGEDRPLRRYFDDLAQIHHRDPVTDVFHDCKVVRDE